MRAKIYTRASAPCPYCDKAKALLKDMSIDYDEVPVTSKEELPEGWKTVPVVFLDGELIGGYDDLVSRLLA